MSIYGKYSETSDVDPISQLLFGAIAGCVAESTCYPLEVIRRRLQINRSLHFAQFSLLSKNNTSKGSDMYPVELRLQHCGPWSPASSWNDLEGARL